MSNQISVQQAHPLTLVGLHAHLASHAHSQQKNRREDERPAAVGRRRGARASLCVLLLVGIGGLALAQFAATPASTEEPRPHPRLWAELDLTAISDIESAAQARQISAERLAAAFFRVTGARNAGAHGRRNEAIAVYRSIASTDDIRLSLSPQGGER